jgi:hypothetical protein
MELNDNCIIPDEKDLTSKHVDNDDHDVPYNYIRIFYMNYLRGKVDSLTFYKVKAFIFTTPQ